MKLSLAVLSLLSATINEITLARALPTSTAASEDSTPNEPLQRLAKRVIDAPAIDRPPVAARPGSRPVGGGVPHAPARPAPPTVNGRPAPPPNLPWLHDLPDEVEDNHASVPRPRPRPRKKPEDEESKGNDDRVVDEGDDFEDKEEVVVIPRPPPAPRQRINPDIPPPARIQIDDALMLELALANRRRGGADEEGDNNLNDWEDVDSEDDSGSEDTGKPETSKTRGRSRNCKRAIGGCAPKNGAAARTRGPWWTADGRDQLPLNSIDPKMWPAVWKEAGEIGAKLKKDLDAYVYHQQSRIETLPAIKRPKPLRLHYNVEVKRDVPLQSEYGEINERFSEAGIPGVDGDRGFGLVGVKSKIQKPSNFHNQEVLEIGANKATKSIISLWSFANKDGTPKAQQVFSSFMSWHSWKLFAGAEAPYLKNQQRHHVINQATKNYIQLAHMYYPGSVDKRATGRDGSQLSVLTGRGVWHPDHPAFIHLLASPNLKTSVNMLIDHNTGMVYPTIGVLTTFPAIDAGLANLRPGGKRYTSIIMQYDKMAGAPERQFVWEPGSVQRTAIATGTPSRRQGVTRPRQRPVRRPGFRPVVATGPAGRRLNTGIRPRPANAPLPPLTARPQVGLPRYTVPTFIEQSTNEGGTIASNRAPDLSGQPGLRLRPVGPDSRPRNTNGNSVRYVLVSDRDPERPLTSIPSGLRLATGYSRLIAIPAGQQPPLSRPSPQALNDPGPPPPLRDAPVERPNPPTRRPTQPTRPTTNDQPRRARSGSPSRGTRPRSRRTGLVRLPNGQMGRARPARRPSRNDRDGR